MKRTALGVDIGGTKTAIGLIADDGRMEAAKRIPMERQPLSAYTQRLIARVRLFLARREMTAEALCGIGIGVRGWVDFSRQELMAFSLFTKMDGRL